MGISVWFFLLCSLNAPGNVWQGDHPARPDDWFEAENWSLREVPSAEDERSVLIPAGLASYPVLTADGSVGGGLRLESGARLSLRGQKLEIGPASPADYDGSLRPRLEEGLVIEKNAVLDTGGTGVLMIKAGGLVNKGKIIGKPSVSVGGRFRGFVIRAGSAVFDTLRLAPSPYPYPVYIRENLTVKGNLELGGGELVIPRNVTVTVREDLIFCGKKNQVRLRVNGKLQLLGTIRSDGSAYCPESDGWVIMKGGGDRVITPGGLLPPIRIQKLSGKVTVKGDLHSLGLHIVSGNTLDLSNGQRLIFGDTRQRWHFDPKDRMIVKTYLPYRSSRDLINQGRILGAPVTFVLYACLEGKLYEITGKYSFEKPEVEAGLLADPFAGSLTLNKPGSRLALKKGKLLIDRKPVGEEAGLPEEEVANITELKLRTIKPPPLKTDGLFNIASFARLDSIPSIGRAIYRITDGRLSTSALFRTGVGWGGAYSFVFQKPVTVYGVRFHQGRLFAIRYIIYADTDGDGVCETLLVDGDGGTPGRWHNHSFSPTRLYQLSFRALRGQRGWEQSYPTIDEFEIYADKGSYEELLRYRPQKPKAPRQEIPHLTVGEEVQTSFPPIEEKNRILRGVIVDLWMFGIHETTDFSFKHLRDYPPFQKMLQGIKQLNANAVTIYIEAQPCVFWPSKYYKSITNARYFEKLEEEKLPKPGKAGEIRKELPVIDPPVKKDILREFCEAMHEEGIKVFVLFHSRITEAYVGPKGQDPWLILCREIAERGADGVYVLGDEQYLGLPNPPRKELPPDDPLLVAFRKRWGPDAQLPRGWEESVNYKKWVLFHYERTAQRLRERVQAIKEVNPSCLTLTNIASGAISCNNRMTYALAYDIIGHLSGVDLLGTDYIPQETRRFVSASRYRTATVVDGAPSPMGLALQAIMQGAKLFNYYRYNYISLWNKTERRRKEYQLIETLERWGITKARTPRMIALVISRASEDWWDNAHGTFWLGYSPEAKRGFWTSRLINEFLLRNGYPFDVYYLDQPEDLLSLPDYKLLILPFAYSASRESVKMVKRAFESGSKILIMQKRGEVDELAVPYEEPAFNPLIREGEKRGTVLFLDRDLIKWETEPSFDDELSGIIDRLLGEKAFHFKNYGYEVEPYCLERGQRVRFVTLINWGEEAEIELGLRLPNGNYKILLVSSDSPTVQKRGSIGGKAVLNERDLRLFAVRLEPHQVLSICITPTSIDWF